MWVGGAVVVALGAEVGGGVAVGPAGALEGDVAVVPGAAGPFVPVPVPVPAAEPEPAPPRPRRPEAPETVVRVEAAGARPMIATDPRTSTATMARANPASTPAQSSRRAPNRPGPFVTGAIVGTSAAEVDVSAEWG